MRKFYKDRYLPRDISWMFFNRRILQEARRESVPLLERLAFLGIYSNNLDEFFRVRVATQSRVAECEDSGARKAREEAISLIKIINKLNSKYSKEYETAIRELIEKLREEKIHILSDKEVDEEQLAYIRNYYMEKLNGLLVPVKFSAIKQFDLEADDNIYLAVRLHKGGGDRKKYEYGFLELPVATCGRFFQLPEKDGNNYLMYLDDVIRCCLPYIFCGQEYEGYEAFSFKFTRDAEMDIDNDIRGGILQKISKGLKTRKKGVPLRIVYDAAMPQPLLKQLLKVLSLNKLDTILAGGRYHNHKDLMNFPSCGRNDLKYERWEPILRSELQHPAESFIEKIRRGDRFIHVPYHSFDSYIRVLQEAAINPDVKGIQTTLYRLARNSKVVKALIGAARNGKKVTVVIELLARFDEASNMDWSKKMQEAGIQVIFGVEGLKIHSKVTHISFRKGADIACISTGNFHEGNAKAYTDYMVMTAHRPIVKDVETLFNFIKRPYVPTKFKELLVSPNEMRGKFMRLINEEIKNKHAGRPAYIKVKINHITDPFIVEKLYEAAACGVPVQLLVRGNCSLIPGLPELCGNMQIKGIIDRYLEHSRIFIFAAGGEEKVFIGSADWMPRNLNARIEVVMPVYDKAIKEDLKFVVETGLADTSQARIVDGSGSDELEKTAEPVRSQEVLYHHYRQMELEIENELKINNVD